MIIKHCASVALHFTCFVLIVIGGLFTNADPAQASDVLSATELATREQRTSYALGMVLGNQFREKSIDVDLDLYMQGLKDAMAGDETLLTETESRSAVNRLQRELKMKPVISETEVSEPSGIEVSFKLDTRLTKGMYMGDRWVSPPIFTIVQEGQEATIEARIKVVDAKGRALKADTTWIASDPEMVMIQPLSGGDVKIIVRRTGQSTLKVVSQDIVRDMSIKAMQKEGSIQVEISK
jgi:hypothetical protein